MKQYLLFSRESDTLYEQEKSSCDNEKELGLNNLLFLNHLSIELRSALIFHPEATRDPENATLPVQTDSASVDLIFHNIRMLLNLVDNLLLLRNYTPEGYKFIATVSKIIEEHLTDPNFCIKILADLMAMSHSNLYKKVRQFSGRNINEFIRIVRLTKAAELFRHYRYSVSEVALRVGLTDVKYFREQFSRQFGLKPSEYLKQFRSAPHLLESPHLLEPSL